MKHIVILALLSGCAGSYTKIDFSKVGEAPMRADEAINVIAADYGLKYQPNVYWYGSGFSCPDQDYAWVPDGLDFCVDGVFNEWTQDIAVSNYGLTMPIYRTALAHELCHQKSWEESGEPDERHIGPCFESGGIVDKENQKLYEMGM